MMKGIVIAKDLTLVAIDQLEALAEQEPVARVLTVLRLQVGHFDTLLGQSEQ